MSAETIRTIALIGHSTQVGTSADASGASGAPGALVIWFESVMAISGGEERCALLSVLRSRIVPIDTGSHG